jgi:hypothetical protein
LDAARISSLMMRVCSRIDEGLKNLKFRTFGDLGAIETAFHALPGKPSAAAGRRPTPSPRTVSADNGRVMDADDLPRPNYTPMAIDERFACSPRPGDPYYNELVHRCHRHYLISSGTNIALNPFAFHLHPASRVLV